MSLKDLDIYFRTNAQNDINSISQTFFVKQQIKNICVTEINGFRFNKNVGSGLDELKFNNSKSRQIYLLNYLESKCKLLIKGLQTIAFSVDRSDIFNRKIYFNVNYSKNSDSSTLTNSSFKFYLNK